MNLPDGYAHSDYAWSLAEFGRPIFLPHCQGWLLKRQIPHTAAYDAMGCYPLFSCQNWAGLETDLATLGPGLVSLSLVPDPFGDFDLPLLRRCFDVVRPFKPHFVADLSRPRAQFVSRHHQRNVRKALKKVTVERCQQPAQHLDKWLAMYATLIKRHNITGIAAFSRQAFAWQMQVSGLVAFRAIHHHTTVGMSLWYVNNSVGYYHLAAYTPLGYSLAASFALFWQAMDHFAGQGIRWLNLGGGAGLHAKTDGLTRFKQGWATDTRLAYFCGRIFNKERYRLLCRDKNSSSSDYFPAYRQRN